MSRFEVVGDDYEEVEFVDEEGNAWVSGDVLGHDIMGASPRLLPRDAGNFLQRMQHGGLRPARPRPKGRLMPVPKKPEWRHQLAPGVIQPDEGLVPLPLTPLQAGGTFAAATTQITFQGQLQKPFRAERLLVSVVRTGATATGRLLAQLFVGTDLQQADINGFDIEIFGAPTAFGTRLTCKAAQPGVLIRLITTITTAPQNNDTVFASVSIAGRVVH